MNPRPDSARDPLPVLVREPQLHHIVGRLVLSAPHPSLHAAVVMHAGPAHAAAGELDDVLKHQDQRGAVSLAEPLQRALVDPRQRGGIGGSDVVLRRLTDRLRAVVGRLPRTP
jgi:hypothetical protein